MTRDPYRELAQKNRIEIKKVQVEQEKQPVQGSSRMERKEQKKQTKYPLLKVLLMFFITLPFITLFLYTLAKDRDFSSTAVMTENTDSAGSVYIDSEDNEDQDELAEEEEVDRARKETEDKRAEPAREATAAVHIEEREEEQNESRAEKQVETKPAEEKKKAELETPPAKKEELKKEEPEPKKEAASNDDKQPEGKIIYHTVKPQETVFRIAMTYYKSQAGIEKIRQANNLNGNEIRVGQVLKIPLP